MKMSKGLLFNEKKYEEAFHAVTREEVQKIYFSGKCKSFANSVKNGFINYTPILGHLPVTFQKYLKDNYKRAFGGLDIKTATLASALVTFVFAAQIGLKLNGFDIGYLKEASQGEIPQYVSYIKEYLPFLGLENGFPKSFTQTASWYLIVSSGFRTCFNLIGKPIGTPLLEIPIAIGKMFSGRSKIRQEAEEEIKENQERSSMLEQFTEKERRNKESALAKKTLEEFLKFEKTLENDSLGGPYER